MEKVKVDQGKCVGCGICIGQCPKYFIFNDNGLSEETNTPVEASDKSDILSSIEMCPTEAIVIEEEK
ncbi:MAG: ferredoxin [Bacilli bacterium]